MEYKKIIHIGDGKFEAIMEDESRKTAGPNVCGMIRYTYFEDFTLPELNWSIERMQLLQDYNKKLLEDHKSGKLQSDIANGTIKIETFE